MRNSRPVIGCNLAAVFCYIHDTSLPVLYCLRQWTHSEDTAWNCSYHGLDYMHGSISSVTEWFHTGIVCHNMLSTHPHWTVSSCDRTNIDTIWTSKVDELPGPSTIKFKFKFQFIDYWLTISSQSRVTAARCAMPVVRSTWLQKVSSQIYKYANDPPILYKAKQRRLESCNAEVLFRVWGKTVLEAYPSIFTINRQPPQQYSKTHMLFA